MIISNPVDSIKKNKVKDVFIYQTKLIDTTYPKTEVLRLVFSYDTIGRRISTQDFYKGNLMGIWRYYYNSNNFECIKTDYVNNDGKVSYQNTASPSILLQCQKEIFSSTSKFYSTLNSNGLLSVMVDYSKVIIEKRETGNLYDENNNLTNEFMYTIDTDKPQLVLRFEYTYY